MKRLFLIIVLVLGLSAGSVVKATNNHCEHNCSTPTPHSTWKPSPSPTVTPSTTPEETYTPEPTETPVETTEPTPGFTLPVVVTDGPPSALQLPSCMAPLWAPTVSYDGQVGNTFNYHWTTVKDELHTYLVWYGYTKDFLPYNVIVHGESVSLTMYGGHTNWMKVAGYEEPGCTGPFSQVVN